MLILSVHWGWHSEAFIEFAAIATHTPPSQVSGPLFFSLSLSQTHTHTQCCRAAVYSCNVTWRGANEPREGPWPEACRHLSLALLKCLFITLIQLHLLLSPASRHANLNTLGLSRQIQSMISERREPFPPLFFLFSYSKSPTLSTPPHSFSVCLPKTNAGGEENWVETEGRGKEREGGMDR